MKLKLSIALLGVVFSAGCVVAADIEAGKSKAGVCIGCHGPDGISLVPTYPNLKGQKVSYLAKQLKDFKSGKRKDPIMAGFAKGLSDDDITNISAYYESLGNK